MLDLQDFKDFEETENSPMAVDITSVPVEFINTGLSDTEGEVFSTQPVIEDEL